MSELKQGLLHLLQLSLYHFELGHNLVVVVVVAIVAAVVPALGFERC
jgi:hypothetical protein